ncbi:HTH domain-containing protein [Candidatus Bathyarchaeota archaeon]|nr:HTH domain-containing protein [Candidatus Bathyarchaeota archaeon]
MALPYGFTKRKLDIWSMRRDGLSLSEIARKLGVTRQAIHKLIKTIDDQVIYALKSVAIASKIDIRYVDVNKGILLGYSYETNNRVIVTFSTIHGVQIWHHHSGNCEGCVSNENCRKIILDEAEERSISLTDDEKKLSPTELASIIFSRVIPGLEP